MEYIIYLPEYRVIICKTCQYAILPSEIDSHFTPTRPHGFTKAVRKQIVEKVTRIPALIQDREELKQSEFPFPIDTDEPIPALGVPKVDGFRCTIHVAERTCPYICGDLRNIQKHCSSKHSWINSKTRGRPRKSDGPGREDIPWRHGVKYQRFFKQGAKSGFFEVGRAIEGEESNTPPPKTTWELFQQRVTQERHRIEEIARRKIEATDESREPNPWLRRTGWARHLGGFDHVKMRDLVRPVGDDERDLAAIHQAFDRLIHSTQTIAVTDIIGQAALFEVHRKEPSKKPTKPFNSRMDKTTFKQYTGVWKQLLSYIWRGDDLEEQERPKYKLSHKQQVAFDFLIDAVNRIIQLPRGARDEACKEANQLIELAILELCITLLDHPFGDHQYRSGIISGLAVLGLQEGGRWANAEDYTPKLSAVIKLARLMVVQKAYNLRQESIARKRGRSMSAIEAEEEATSHVKLVQIMTRKFMMLVDNQGEPHPMDWMLDTRTYGLYIRYHTAAEGTIGWKGMDTILYQQIQFNMRQLRSMVHGLVAETKRLLIQDLLLLHMDEHGEIQGEPLPPIDWANTVDNPTEQKIGWSFLDDTRNQFTAQIPGREWLAKRVLEKPALRRDFIQCRDANRITWRDSTIDKYYRKIQQFQEPLLILMHLLGGQAGRAREIISIRHRNTANGGVRNIFIDGGLVLFVTAYHKGYEYSEKVKLIQRFLPREVGELLVYYLWLVLPFFETMQLVVDGVDELSAFVWGNHDSDTKEEERVDEGSRVRNRGMVTMGTIKGPKLMRIHLGPVDPDNLDQESQEEVPPARPRARAWTSERMRKIMQRESHARMGVKLNISAWRQVSIAIARKFIREEYRFDTHDSESDECDGYEEDNDQGDSAWDLQSGHGTRMAGLIYARLLFEGPYETQSQKEKYRQVSQEWHRFLGFPSSTEGVRVSIGRKRKRSHWEAVHQEMQEFRWKQLKHTNIQGTLQTMLGKDARFRGKQRPAIEAIMQGQSPIMVIMGTGGGKSMLFMLPAASVSDGTTIVIVPLVALQGDLQQRCEDSRISSIMWCSRKPYESARIVFVTPESAVSKTFAGFIHRLQELRQLDRIVIDECHTILNGSPQFQPKLRQLGELCMFGVQMVYLTATLPPRDKEEFRRLMCIPALGLQLFRDRTTRKNVRYHVQEIDAPEPMDTPGRKADRVDFREVIPNAVFQLVQQKLELYPSPAKIIIYCRSIKGAEGLGERLGCAIYHRNVDCVDGKARRVDDWRNARNDGSLGQGRVIVATNALGLGVDVPDIRVVIHVGKIWALKDYTQESGRAGRDGKRSEAIIIQSIGAGGNGYEQKRDIPKEVDIEEFISGSICRRVILDQVIDAPRARDGCEEGEEPCDVCQPPFHDRCNHSEIGLSRPVIAIASSPAESSYDDRASMQDQTQQRDWGISKMVAQRRSEGVEGKELVEFLEEWYGKCRMCHWVGRANAWHDTPDCPMGGVEGLQQQITDVQEGIRYADFSCCFYCGVPQGICDRWDQIDEQGWWVQREGRRCQYSGVLVGAVVTMLREGEDQVTEDLYRWMEGLGVDITDKKGVYQWLGQRVEWGGFEANRLTQVFHRLAKQHQAYR